jgi:hypothetical protein
MMPACSHTGTDDWVGASKSSCSPRPGLDRARKAGKRLGRPTIQAENSDEGQSSGEPAYQQPALDGVKPTEDAASPRPRVSPVRAPVALPPDSVSNRAAIGSLHERNRLNALRPSLPVSRFAISSAILLRTGFRSSPPQASWVAKFFRRCECGASLGRCAPNRCAS